MDKTATHDLYASTGPVGLLKGFSPVPNQLEVDVVVPYSGESMPGFGEFLLAELGPGDALVGRVARFSAAGHLVSAQGDAYLADLVKTDDTPPAPIMRQMLRYTMKMSLLGHIRLDAQTKSTKFQFLVGERAFATLGCRVRGPRKRRWRFCAMSVWKMIHRRQCWATWPTARRFWTTCRCVSALTGSKGGAALSSPAPAMAKAT